MLGQLTTDRTGPAEGMQIPGFELRLAFAVAEAVSSCQQDSQIDGGRADAGSHLER